MGMPVRPRHRQLQVLLQSPQLLQQPLPQPQLRLLLTRRLWLLPLPHLALREAKASTTAREAKARHLGQQQQQSPAQEAQRIPVAPALDPVAQQTTRERLNGRRKYNALLPSAVEAEIVPNSMYHSRIILCSTES
jgi:hypothetical protein